MQCNAKQCNAIKFNTPNCSAMQMHRIAVHFMAMQCNSMRCSSIAGSGPSRLKGIPIPFSRRYTFWLAGRLFCMISKTAVSANFEGPGAFPSSQLDSNKKIELFWLGYVDF